MQASLHSAALRASGSHVRPHKRLCTPPAAVAGPPSAVPSLLGLSHMKLTPRGADSASEPSTSCAQCRYPCEGHSASCDAHDYLARWREDAFMKPDGFDAAASLPLAAAAGVDAAAVSVGGRANGRWKGSNQDTFLLHPLPAADGSFLVGVFDGHGRLGHEVAARARDAIAAAAAAAPPPPAPAADADDHEGWLAAHLEAAAASVDAAAADFSRSGAAAVVCAVRPGRVTAAWTGDSRAVLGLQGAAAGVRAVIPLTRDHKPDPRSCPQEAERILAAGGRVDRLATDRQGNPTGPYRVFLADCWAPGLALSRALGDHLVRHIGVVATPEVYSMPLPTPSGAAAAAGSGVSNLATACTMAPGGGGGPAARHVLIAASDGLWEWVSNEEAVAMAWGCASAEEAACALVGVAQREWAVRYRGRACDDITVAVTFLPAC